MDIVDRKIDTNIERAQMTISSIIAEKGELVSEVTKLAGLPQVTIHDREYLETKTKGMIARCEAVLNTLENRFESTEIDDKGEPKTKFNLYAVDVYAKIVNAVAVQVRELRELNRMVMGIDVINAEQMVKKQEEDNGKKDNTVKLSSSDLLKIIKEAGAKSQVRAVNAEFEVIKQTPDVKGEQNGTEQRQ